jgi:hypothetical protein
MTWAGFMWQLKLYSSVRCVCKRTYNWAPHSVPVFFPLHNFHIVIMKACLDIPVVVVAGSHPICRGEPSRSGRVKVKQGIGTIAS